MRVLVPLVSFFPLCCVVYSVNVQDPRYATECTLAAPTGRHTHHCDVALFAFQTFHFSGAVVPLADDLCTVPETKPVLDKPVAVLVKRGVCSFTEKAKNAQAAGFNLLIVVNNDASGFPMGPPQVDFKLNIPVLMSGEGLWDEVSKCGPVQSLVGVTTTVDTAALTVTFEAVPTPQLATNGVTLAATSDSVPGTVQRPAPGNMHQPADLNAQAVLATQSLFIAAAVVSVLLASVALCSVFHSMLAAHTSPTTTATTSSASAVHEYVYTYTTHAMRIFTYVLIVLVFTALRLGTLRIYSSSGTGAGSDSRGGYGGDSVVYNHRETDERVFETLVYSVLRDSRDYKLHAHTIQELRLAEENYADELFIHPPLFVYLSALLHGFLHVPLPLIPILLQVLTMCLLPVIAQAILHCVDLTCPVGYCSSNGESGTSSSATTHSVGVCAMVLYSCCPIIAFCSQKFWIDNALMMAVTVCVAAHLILVRYDPNTNNSAAAAVFSCVHSHLLSGIVFGSVGLNCKITALALLPFSVGWILLQQYLEYVHVHNVDAMRPEEGRTRLLGAVSWAAACVGVYIIGAALTYAPWAYLYWYYTGRYSPNAWPSATMLQRSPFVQAAVNKPWYTYLLTLLQLSPVHVLGLVGAVLPAVLLVPRLACETLKAAVCVAGSSTSTEIVGSSNISAPSLDVVTASAPLPAVETVPSTSNSEPGVNRAKRGSVRRQKTALRQVDGPSPPVIVSGSSMLPLQSTTGDSAGSAGSAGGASTSAVPVTMLQVLVLSLWPLGFLIGLTLLGSLGSGFQSRFLMPMLPGTCVLAAVYVQWAQECAAKNTADGNMSAMSTALAMVMLLFVVHSTVHVVYYGVMFAPLYADLDVSIVDVICSVLTHAYSAPETREGFQATLKFMNHFGMVK